MNDHHQEARQGNGKAAALLLAYEEYDLVSY